MFMKVLKSIKAFKFEQCVEVVKVNEVIESSHLISCFSFNSDANKTSENFEFKIIKRLKKKQMIKFIYHVF